ncbi:MAG TPA: hypothetical protein VER32_05800 [Pyrinomonadaceae bacterium]|nr:hypothetical protein [Pyrinomonadaceae bacterium]
MNFRNKLIPVALVAALLGGSVGAFVMRPANNETAAKSETAPALASNVAPASTAYRFASGTTSTTEQANVPAPTERELSNFSEAEQAAYREGFADGVRAAREEGLFEGNAVAPSTRRAPERVVYRESAPRTRTVRSRASNNGARRVYYDYEQPRKRSFWSKHRDKLTVAMGAGGGALIGGLVGGKKGAVIGGLAGAGGSALYTYKLRKRDRRY